MIAVFVQYGAIVTFLSLWCLMTTGIGRFLLSAFPIRFASLGEIVFLSAGIGIIMTSYAVFLVGITGSLNSYGIYIILISLSCLAIAGWSRNFNTVPQPSGSRSHWDIPASVSLWILLIALFLLVLAPETGKDALIYHLAVPKLYLNHHGFYFILGNIFASYPLLGEMHYLLALFFGNDIFAKSINFTVLWGILLGMGLFARFLMREHFFPSLSMLIFISIPSVFAVSHASYNDLFVTFFTLAAVYSFIRWSECRVKAWLILCGIFSGSAAACKYTALLMTPLGVLGILWFAFTQKIEGRQALRLLTLYIAAAFIAGSPFYFKNLFVTGNPFHPFLYGIFGGSGWDSDQARLYDIFLQNLGMGRDFLDYLLLPWNLSLRAKIDSPEFDGILGPVFLLTLPFLLAARRWETPLRVILVYSLLTFLFWASSAQQIRYLIPLFPLLALTTGAIISRYRNRMKIFMLLLCIVAGSLAYNGYYISRDYIKHRPVNVLVGIETREDYLMRTLPTYRMYHFINHNLPHNSRVFLIYMKNYTFLCECNCYSDSMFEAHTLQMILQKESSAEGVRNRLKEMGFTHILFDRFFLLGEPSPLSADQKKLFLDFQNMHLRVVIFQGSYYLYQLL